MVERIFARQLRTPPAVLALERHHAALGLQPDLTAGGGGGGGGGGLGSLLCSQRYLQEHAERFRAAAFGWIEERLGPPGAASESAPWLRQPAFRRRDLHAEADLAVREDLVGRLLQAPRSSTMAEVDENGSSDDRYRLFLLRYRRLPVLRSGRLSQQAGFRTLHLEGCALADAAEAELGYRPAVSALGRAVVCATARPAYPLRMDHTEAVLDVDGVSAVRERTDRELALLRRIRDQPPAAWPPPTLAEAADLLPAPAPEQHRRWRSALQQLQRTAESPQRERSEEKDEEDGEVVGDVFPWPACPEPVEHYVDFETVQSLGDSLTHFPAMESRSMIAMIGILTVTPTETVFASLVAERLSHAKEARLLDEMDRHLARWHPPEAAKETLPPPPLYHWSGAEVSWWSAAEARRRPEESERRRAPAGGRWVDLMAPFRKGALRCGGTGGKHGLKAVAAALRRAGHIPPAPPEDELSALINNGMAAQVGMLRCEERAQLQQERGEAAAAAATLASAGRQLLREHAATSTAASEGDLMGAIAGYNRQDCEMLRDILGHLRSLRRAGRLPGPENPTHERIDRLHGKSSPTAAAHGEAAPAVPRPKKSRLH